MSPPVNTLSRKQLNKLNSVRLRGSKSVPACGTTNADARSFRVCVPIASYRKAEVLQCGVFVWLQCEWMSVVVRSL